MHPKDVIALIKEKGIQAVDLRFVDLPGLWQHFSLPAQDFEAEAFEEGIGFDGSSIRGFKAIEESAYDRAWLAELGVTEISSAYLDNEFEQIGRVGKCGK